MPAACGAVPLKSAERRAPRRGGEGAVAVPLLCTLVVLSCMIEARPIPYPVRLHC